MSLHTARVSNYFHYRTVGTFVGLNLKPTLLCASQECKFKSWPTPQWSHRSPAAMTSDHNLDCTRGPGKRHCQASGR